MSTIAKVGPLETYALCSSDARSWSLFPYAAQRIARFAQKYDSDADVMMLIASLKQQFTHPRPMIQTVVLLNGDKSVDGHLLVSLEEWFGTRFATLVQYETDIATPHNLTTPTLDWVEAWARENGAQFMQALALNDKIARAYSVFRGFDRNRIIMRKSLSTDVAQTEKSA